MNLPQGAFFDVKTLRIVYKGEHLDPRDPYVTENLAFIALKEIRNKQQAQLAQQRASAQMHNIFYEPSYSKMLFPSAVSQTRYKTQWELDYEAALIELDEFLGVSK